MIIFIILMSALFATAFIVMLCVWSVGTWWSDPKIKFEEFKKFYDINNSRWKLDTTYVRCKINGEYNHVDFRFGFIDFYKYLWWQKQLDKQNKSKSHMEATARMLDAVKKDIENAKSTAQKERDKAIKDLASILTNVDLKNADRYKIANIIKTLKSAEIT